MAWHAQEAGACEKAKHWFGAAFHWNQLASLEPNNWRHLERRGIAYIGLEEWDKAAAAFDQAIEQQASGGAVDSSFTWNYQIELRVLRREAEELLGAKPNSP